MFKAFRDEVEIGQGETQGQAVALCNEDNKHGWRKH